MLPEDNAPPPTLLTSSLGSTRYFQLEIFKPNTLLAMNFLFFAVIVALSALSFSLSSFQFECRSFCRLNSRHRALDEVGGDDSCTVADGPLDAGSLSDVATCVGNPLLASSITSGGGAPPDFFSQLAGFKRFTIIVGTGFLPNTAFHGQELLTGGRGVTESGGLSVDMAAVYSNITNIQWNQQYFQLTSTTPSILLINAADDVVARIAPQDVHRYSPRINRAWGADAGAVHIFEFPLSMLGDYPDTVHTFRIDFGNQTVVHNDTLDILAANTHTQLDSVPPAAAVVPVLNVRFIQQRPAYMRFELVFRLAAFGFAILASLKFLSGWMPESKGLAAGVREMGCATFFRRLVHHSLKLPFPLKAAIGFHLVVALRCNPFFIFYFAFPRSRAWLFIEAELLYTVAVVATITFFNYILTSLARIDEIELQVYRLRLFLFSTIFSVAFAAAIFASSSLRGTGSTGKPGGLFQQHNTASLFTSILLFAWAAVLLVFFWAMRSRQVWDKGVALFQGTTRIFVLWLRVNSFLCVLVMVCWVFFINLVTATNSWLVPLYNLNGSIEVMLLLTLSTAMLFLFFPLAKSMGSFPPNPNLMKRSRPAPRTPSENEPVSTSPSLRACESVMIPAAAGTAPSTAIAVAAYGTTDSHVLASRWFDFEWSDEHFRSVHDFRLSGFFFETESQKKKFDHVHQNKPHYKKLRSFFCLETAISCLRLSEEVYNRYDESFGDLIFVEHQQSCMEVCLLRCCMAGDGAAAGCACGGGGSTQMGENDFIDGVDIDPEAPSRSRLPSPIGTPTASDASPTAAAAARINVEQYRFRLYKVLVAHGVQVLLAHQAAEGREVDSTSPHLASPAFVPKVVIAFRGTCNARNALTDVDIGRTIWHEMAHVSNRQAKVHSGFANAWDELRPLVSQHLRELLTSLKAQVTIITTGHSLGGSLAALCAFSLRAGALSSFGEHHRIACYTFGMPKVGNETFSRHYNHHCPDTYRVVNENDKVAFVAHCGRRHVGHTVCIDRDGNLIVEPNVLETAFDVLLGAGSSFRNHLLQRYTNSINKAVTAQDPSHIHTSS